MSHLKIDRKTAPLPSMAQQHFEPECNINTIMKKYRGTGILGDPTARPTIQATFADLSAVPDYAEAYAFVQQSADAFLQLPAAIKARFGGDPTKLLAFLNDAKNRPEAEALGLLAPKPPKQTKKESKDDDQTSTPLDVTGLTDTTQSKTAQKAVKKRQLFRMEAVDEE